MGCADPCGPLLFWAGAYAYDHGGDAGRGDGPAGVFDDAAGNRSADAEPVQREGGHARYERDAGGGGVTKIVK